jgi:hypothetical protein
VWPEGQLRLGPRPLDPPHEATVLKGAKCRCLLAKVGSHTRETNHSPMKLISHIRKSFICGLHFSSLLVARAIMNAALSRSNASTSGPPACFSQFRSRFKAVIQAFLSKCCIRGEFSKNANMCAPLFSIIPSAEPAKVIARSKSPRINAAMAASVCLVAASTLLTVRTFAGTFIVMASVAVPVQ